MKEILYISACEALSTVKRKYKMDEKIELMINNWIRGIQETKRTSRTYYELFGQFVSAPFLSLL